MALQLILGSSGSGKSYELYEEIIKKSMEHEDTNYIVIVPEQFTMQTQKDLVSMHPRHGIMNIDILSFLRLAYRVFDEVGHTSQVVLEDTGKSMLLRRVVDEKSKDLVLFQNNVKKQGFISELKSLMSEIFQYSVTVEQLQQMEEKAKDRPLLQAKLKDITTIYTAFKNLIHEKYITAEEILDVVTELVDQSVLLRNSVICFDGFTGFTPSQYKLLRRLLTCTKSVIVTVTVDEREDVTTVDEEFRLFHLSKKTISKLVDIANDENVNVMQHIYAGKRSGAKVPYRFRESEALAALEHNIFRYPYKTYEKHQEDISVHSAMDAKAEVNFVVRTIKKLIREEKYRYKDIAVVTGNIESYGHIFRREMEKSKIPCFVDNKKDILSNPYVEFLRSAMAIVNLDYSYESIFRYLRCGLSDISMEDVDELENYVIALGIRGHNMWIKEWKYTYRSKKPIDLVRLNTLRLQIVNDLEELYTVLSNKTSTVLEFTKALYEFSVRQSVFSKLQNYVEHFKERLLPLLAKEYEQIYRIVMELFDKFVELLGNERMSLKDYDKIFESGLTEAKVGLIPPGMDQIVVGDTTRTRLKDIKALFFVGVNDDIIPSSKNGGGILSELDRELFVENDVELAPTKRQTVYLEQFYLYLNLTKPQNRLYLTYHKLKDDGKGARPAYLIGKIQKLFPNIIVFDEDEKKSFEQILGEREGTDYLIDGIRNFGKEEIDPAFGELYSYYYKTADHQEMLKALLLGVFFSNEEKGLGKYVASMLYGDELYGSVTRIERYASCAFSHFMAYGLQLKERVEHKIEVPDIGNLFHMALELFSTKLEESDYTWATLPDDVRTEWASYCVQVAVNQYGNTVLRSNKRNEYLIKRLERIQQRTVWALSEQMKASDFEAFGYEIPFTFTLEHSKKKHIPLKLTGKIDRLDVCKAGDEVYLKIVDYKSGKTTFDLISLYYGLQMQLAVYLSAALDIAMREFKGKEIIPAGILYYHIDDPMIDRTGDVTREILKKLRMNGLVQSDMDIVKLLDTSFKGTDGNVRPKVKSCFIPVETNKDGYPTKYSSVATKHEFEIIKEYVNYKMDTLSEEIMEGLVEVNPYKLGEKTACDYCEFSGICGFDTKVPGYRYRKLNAMDKAEAFEEIVKEVEEDEVDERTGTSHKSEK